MKMCLLEIGAITGAVTAVVSTSLSIANAVKQAEQSRRVAEYQNDVSQFNAKVLENKAKEARSRGQSEANRIRTRAAIFKKQQAARASAAGLDPESGTAARALDDAEFSGALDAERINVAASGQGRDFETSAFNQRASGSVAMMSVKDPTLSIAASAVSGVGGVASSWMNYKAAGGTWGDTMSTSEWLSVDRAMADAPWAV